MAEKIIEPYDGSFLNLELVPRAPERQDSLRNQLIDLSKCAAQIGAWKAQDFILEIIAKEAFVIK